MLILHHGGRLRDRPTPERQVITAAADALGGAERIQKVGVITMEGSASRTASARPHAARRRPRESLGSNRHLESDASSSGRSTCQRPRAPAVATRARLRQSAARRKSNDGLDGDIAFTIGANGQATRQNDAAAQARRCETILGHPIGVLHAALNPSAKLSNLRRQGNLDLVDIATATGDRVTLAVDRTSHFPQWATMAGYHSYLGDVVNKTEFHNYLNVGPSHAADAASSRSVGNWLESDYLVKNTSGRSSRSSLRRPRMFEAQRRQQAGAANRANDPVEQMRRRNLVPDRRIAQQRARRVCRSYRAD